MYATHQPAIASRIAPGMPGWEDRAAVAYALVTTTIRRQTVAVAGMIRAFDRDGLDGVNFPTMRRAFDAIYAGDHVAPLRAAHACVLAGDHAGALLALCALPSLGYAKAGFLLQLVWGVGGCLDVRNERAYGVKAPAWRDGAPDATQRADALAYLRLCADLGGSERLWDRWCAGVSAQWPRTWPTADDVSAQHVRWFDAMAVALWRTGDQAPAMAAD